jgi:uncharacterized protein (DUF305 family)
VHRSVVLIAAAAIVLAGCGAHAAAPTPPAPVQRVDDAFVVRIARHQQTALALARSAAATAHDASVRRLARRIVSNRERMLPGVLNELATIPSQRSLPDLGVSPAQAAEAIGPTALRGTRPVDGAFLALMTRHDEGALALAHAELARGRSAAVKALAQRVSADSAGELARLARAQVGLARRG